jgi:hypothetical protein
MTLPVFIVYKYGNNYFDIVRCNFKIESTAMQLTQGRTGCGPEKRAAMKKPNLSHALNDITHMLLLT